MINGIMVKAAHAARPASVHDREKLDLYYRSNWYKNVVKLLENVSFALTLFIS